VAPVSAGILLYRRKQGSLEVLLVHPGGPFWHGRDAGAWMVPKGGIEPGETAGQAARREFEEELGTAPPGEPRFLCRIRQKGGKWVEAFALEGEFDPDALVSNRFEVEYPPRSGRFRDFPEVDSARWFTLDAAAAMILPSQRPILEALAAELAQE
jgi:predicted NUDIX family NTP pyrophosphohydrolase